MPKAIFHTREVSKYDGTNTYAELVDVLDDSGESDPNSDLWTRAQSGEGSFDSRCEVWLYTDNPAVYGFPPQSVTVFGHELTLADFQTGETLPNDYETQVFVLDV